MNGVLYPQTPCSRDRDVSLLVLTCQNGVQNVANYNGNSETQQLCEEDTTYSVCVFDPWTTEQVIVPDTYNAKPQ